MGEKSSKVSNIKKKENTECCGLVCQVICTKYKEKEIIFLNYSTQ